MRFLVAAQLPPALARIQNRVTPSFNVYQNHLRGIF